MTLNSVWTGYDSHSRCGRDAPFAFKQLGELGGLQDREAREFVDDFFEIGHLMDLLNVVRFG